MPSEVLRYFFHHQDTGLKLQFQIVFQCAPFLKGLKLSCAITMETVSYEQLNHILAGTGISYRKLKETDGKCLVLFYRREVMKEYLSQHKIKVFLGKFGYPEQGMDMVLEHFQMRIQAFAENDGGFPHEMGVFLGYPLEDVKGFMEASDKECLLVGYWKVYSNLAMAKTLFDKYDQAKICAVNEFLSGESIRKIAAYRQSR